MKASTKFLAAAVAAVGAVTLGFTASSSAAPTRPVHSNDPAIVAQIAPKVIPTPDAGLIYTPVVNCRIVDTATAGGRIANGATRSFYVSGSAGFTGQGGPASGCGIPAYATEISARVTGYRAEASGSFAAYAAGSTATLATLYYAKGVNSTSGATLPLGPGTARRLTVKNVSGPAQLDIDVNGYYSPQIHAIINETGGLYSATPAVLSATNPSTGSYAVTLDRDVTGCTAQATMSGGNYYVSAYISGDEVIGTTWALTGGTVTPTNLYWSLNVTC
jgi:hypothetical protein